MEQPREPIPPIVMDYFIKWPETYAIFNQEASIVVKALVTSFFCHFRYRGSYIVTRVITSESHLMLVLQRLGVCKMQNTSLHLQPDGMVDRYIKMVEEHL
jgi:hypothetical protein